LWRHYRKPVTFTLVVDDFGIKYLGKDNADHLLNALKENYEVTEDWAGKLYCGISLDWDYKNKTVDLSMPGYIVNALHKFQHKKPERPQHAPYPARTP
jgi:endonuclease I